MPHREKSGLFLYLNTNKFGITLDPGSPRGSKIFKALVREADVLIENRPLGDMEQMGLGYEDLKKINPGLIMTSIKPFGRSGPYKDYKAYSLNISHVSGQGYLLPLLSPNSDRPPVKAGGNSSDYDPGLVTVVAVMAALFWKGVTGKGQFIELSKQANLFTTNMDLFLEYTLEEKNSVYNDGFAGRLNSKYGTENFHNSIFKTSAYLL